MTITAHHKKTIILIREEHEASKKVDKIFNNEFYEKNTIRKIEETIFEIKDRLEQSLSFKYQDFYILKHNDKQYKYSVSAYSNKNPIHGKIPVLSKKTLHDVVYFILNDLNSNGRRSVSWLLESNTIDLSQIQFFSLDKQQEVFFLLLNSLDEFYLKKDGYLKYCDYKLLKIEEDSYYIFPILDIYDKNGNIEYWWSKNGEKRKLDEMSIGHLNNCLKLVYSNYEGSKYSIEKDLYFNYITAIEDAIRRKYENGV